MFQGFTVSTGTPYRRLCSESERGAWQDPIRATVDSYTRRSPWSRGCTSSLPAPTLGSQQTRRTPRLRVLHGETSLYYIYCIVNVHIYSLFTDYSIQLRKYLYGSNPTTLPAPTTRNGNNMSESETGSSKVNSIRQKRVLEIAEKKPNASLSEISEEIPSATVDYVDRILDRFGDPAASAEENSDDSQPEDTGAKTNKHNKSQSKNPNKEKMSKEDPPTSPPPIPGTGSDSTDESDQTDVARESEEPSIADNLRGSQKESDEETPDPDDLTQKERETLRAIHYEPTAAQKEIATMLGVSRATVSNRVNAISGFNWQNRESFVEEMFDEEIIIDDSITDGENQSNTEETNSNSYNENSAISDTSNSTASELISQEIDDSNVDSKTGGVNQTAGDSVDPDVSGDIAEMANKMNEIEHCLDKLEENIENTDSHNGSLLNNSELLHKVIHACMNSDIVSEEEEIKILESITD